MGVWGLVIAKFLDEHRRAVRWVRLSFLLLSWPTPTLRARSSQPLGGRCARCAASQRSNIFKQSFVAAQPWGTAARCARAAPLRSVPTLSNNRLLLRNRGGPLRALRRVATFQNFQTIVCCCATLGDRCARFARCAASQRSNIVKYSNNRLLLCNRGGPLRALRAHRT